VYVLVGTGLFASAGGGFLLARPRGCPGSQQTANTNAHEIRNAVQRWRGLHEGSTCPTIAQLVQDGEIDAASKTDDAWGLPYRITCTEDEVVVRSAGPDKRWGTEDDIVLPKGRGGDE
jgi:general secretion pathway protein G